MIVVVRGRGLEPPCLAAPAPKAGVATNYTTRAIYSEDGTLTCAVLAIMSTH